MLELSQRLKKLLEKVLAGLLFIIGIPVYLIFVLLCAALGVDIDIERLSDKELAGYMLLVYGVAALAILAYSSPPLYLPPNLAIIALFLGIGGPIIFIGCIVVYVKMKDRKRKEWMGRVDERKKRRASMREATFSGLGYDWVELKEQLGRGAINQEEYDQKKELLEEFLKLNEQLLLGNIHLMEYEQKKKELMERKKPKEKRGLKTSL